MENLNLITRRRLLTAMALSPLLWQMRGARAAEVDPQRIVALEWLPVELLLALLIAVEFGVGIVGRCGMGIDKKRKNSSAFDYICY